MNYLKLTEKGQIRERNQRFYMSSIWKKARTNHIHKHPLCEHCLANDILQAVQEVHHIVSITEDYDRRLDPDNLLSLCKSCHSKQTYRDNANAFKKPSEVNKMDVLLEKILKKNNK